MDWGQVVGDAVLAAGTVVTGMLAKRASGHAAGAARIGKENAERIETVRKQTNGRQRQMIKEAVEEVAREHPQLVSEAIAVELVRTVLDGILEGHLEHGYEPTRRDEDRHRYGQR